MRSENRTMSEVVDILDRGGVTVSAVLDNGDSDFEKFCVIDTSERCIYETFEGTLEGFSSAVDFAEGMEAAARVSEGWNPPRKLPEED